MDFVANYIVQNLNNTVSHNNFRFLTNYKIFKILEKNNKLIVKKPITKSNLVSSQTTEI